MDVLPLHMFVLHMHLVTVGDRTDKGKQPVCHRVVTDGGERSKSGKRSAECGTVPPRAGLARQVV